MAYRRRHGITRSATFQDYTTFRPPPTGDASSSTSSLSVACRDNGSQYYGTHRTAEILRKVDNPSLQNGLDALTYSFNHIADTNLLEIRRKGTNFEDKNLDVSSVHSPWMMQIQPQSQISHEDQLKTSRNVAVATAAKAKLLLRELKTVKADLAFAKQRCTQLEEENKILREACEKGDNPADDDLIRLQLEMLVAEKASLAHENSVYASENRFLREIVEYHQLITMQDDEGIDEEAISAGVSRTTSVHSLPDVSPSRSSSMTTDIMHHEAPPSFNSPTSSMVESLTRQ